MSKANRSIDLAVDGIEGFWSELPQWFSFSSILEAEICPLRWSLKRAVYPDLWEERGYPDSFNTTMLAGTVVHESLEIIIRALIDKGCTSIQTPEAVEILRSLGGYSAVILRVADENIGRLEKNPRCRSRLEYLRRELTLRSSEIRQEIQSLLSRLIISAGIDRSNSKEKAYRSESQTIPNLRLSEGSYPEMLLRSTKLKMSGRADLVTISGRDVHIVDYKTGKSSDHHSEQLRIYALTWSRHDSLDPSHPYVTRLTMSYPNEDVEVDVPTADELDNLEIQTVARIKNLANRLAEEPPQASPSEEKCRFCSVRHLCDPYWHLFAVDASVESFLDLRGEVVEQSGPKLETSSSRRQ